CLRLARRRIVHLLQADDVPAQGPAAIDDGDLGPAVFGQPVSPRIAGGRGCRSGETGDAKRGACKNLAHECRSPFKKPTEIGVDAWPSASVSLASKVPALTTSIVLSATTEADVHCHETRYFYVRSEVLSPLRFHESAGNPATGSIKVMPSDPKCRP